MKILAIVLAIVISACSSVSPPNLAADFVTTVEPGAKCEPYFTDVGETHVHSARCKMPNGVISYCSVAADKQPTCVAIYDPNPKPAPASTGSK
jgi:hypothetical protein